MPKPYSQDLRERVVRAVEAGASCHEAAAAFEVSASSAIRWVARWRLTGSAAAKPMGGKRSPLDAHKPWLLELIGAEPDLTLEEIRGRHLEQCLVPTLSPGEIVTMDNLPAHRVAGVREAIEATGAELRLLPPYSRISIRSSNPSQNSKPICERPVSAQSLPFGIGSEPSFSPSPRRVQQLLQARRIQIKLNGNLL